jgi:hypothetical protein
MIRFNSYQVAFFFGAAFFFTFETLAVTQENFLDSLVQPKESRRVIKEHGQNRCDTYGPQTCPVGYQDSHICEETSQGAGTYQVTCLGSTGNKRKMSTYGHIYETKTACDKNDIQHNGGCVPMVLVNEYDSCETVEEPVAYEPLQSDGNGYGCVQKSDGSRCLVDSEGFEVKEALIADSNGDVDVYTKQACYPLDDSHDKPQNLRFPPAFAAPNPPQNKPDVTDSTGCSPFGNQLVCGADPNEVCIGGVCPSGCGSMDLGSGSEFVCFTADTDGDGVPDLNDPDIDGDGIMNHNDPDADGDGIDDPLNDNTNTVNDLNQTLQNRLANYFLNQGSNSGGGVGQGEILAMAESLDRNNDTLKLNLDAQEEGNQIAKESRDGIGQINHNLNGIGSLITDAKNQNKSSLDKISDQLDNLIGCTPTYENPCEGNSGPSRSVDYTPSDKAKSFYKSSYENGMAGIWEEKQAQLQQSPLFEFNNQMANVDFNGLAPDLNFCFNLGAMGNFGCKELDIDSGVFDFIKLIMLVSAGFAAYYIVTIGR